MYSGNKKNYNMKYHFILLWGCFVAHLWVVDFVWLRYRDLLSILLLEVTDNIQLLKIENN